MGETVRRGGGEEGRRGRGLGGREPAANLFTISVLCRHIVAAAFASSFEEPLGMLGSKLPGAGAGGVAMSATKQVRVPPMMPVPVPGVVEGEDGCG